MPLRTLERWCKAGKVKFAEKRGGWWYVNIRKINEMRDSELRNQLQEMRLHKIHAMLSGDVDE